MFKQTEKGIKSVMPAPRAILLSSGSLVMTVAPATTLVGKFLKQNRDPDTEAARTTIAEATQSATLYKRFADVALDATGKPRTPILQVGGWAGDI